MKYARINVFISFLLCFLAGSIKVIAVEGVTPEEFHTVNKGLRPTDVSDYTLWYDTPATKSGASDIWMEYALPMGNGQIGATIEGGLLTDDIQFNEKTLWEGNSTNSSSQGYFQNF